MKIFETFLFLKPTIEKNIHISIYIETYSKLYIYNNNS